MIIAPVRLIPAVLADQERSTELRSAIGLLGDYLAQNECADGGIELGAFHATLSTATPGKAAELPFENHHWCIDLHYVISGIEGYETADPCTAEEILPYNEETDCELFRGPRRVSRFLLQPGWAVIFFPGEGHKPRCDLIGGSLPVRKVVVKIK